MSAIRSRCAWPAWMRPRASLTSREDRRTVLFMSTNSATPSITYSFTVRLAYPNRVGTLARIVSAIGKDGGDIGAVDIVASDAKGMTRDITVRPRAAAHQEQIIARVRTVMSRVI